ncbi:MAG: S-adenosyl-l-methionine hydroxide adenosyltransferase family protein [Candidatus Hydrogenedentota bacterium]
MSLPLVTLTTDFGSNDPYVAAMKGIIYAGCPVATVADLSHEIPRQNVHEAALFAGGALPYFRAGTVHVIVVDPGVGTARRPLAVYAGHRYFICPDNGVLTLVLQHFALEEARVIENPRFMRTPVSTTFHGRDIFAPAAALLAAGVDFHEVGPPAANLVTLDMPAPVLRGGSIEGAVVHVDHFGNCITNIHVDSLEGRMNGCVMAGNLAIERILRTYGDVLQGTPLALISSTGHLEIAISGGSAAQELGIGIGDVVRVAGGE